MENEIKTSIMINENTWNQFKIYCIKKGVTMTEQIEKIIKEVLENEKKDNVKNL